MMDTVSCPSEAHWIWRQDLRRRSDTQSIMVGMSCLGKVLTRSVSSAADHTHSEPGAFRSFNQHLKQGDCTASCCD